MSLRRFNSDGGVSRWLQVLTGVLVLSAISFASFVLHVVTREPEPQRRPGDGVFNESHGSSGCEICGLSRVVVSTREESRNEIEDTPASHWIAPHIPDNHEHEWHGSGSAWTTTVIGGIEEMTSSMTWCGRVPLLWDLYGYRPKLGEERALNLAIALIQSERGSKERQLAEKAIKDAIPGLSW